MRLASARTLLARPHGNTEITTEVMRHLACVPLCVLVLCGCGASTAGKSGATLTSTTQPAIGSGALGGPPARSSAPPPSVIPAGGGELAEFNRGRAVVEQWGCLACHRIGDQGSGEPGPALTHIGSMMPERIIERVLINPEPPMPSFSHLPRGQFRALVRFLSLLRCPGAAGRLMPHGC